MRAFSTRLAVSCFKEYSSLTASVSTDLHTRANRIVLRKQNPGGTDRHAKRSAALLQRHACEKARMQRQRHACKKVCSSSAEASFLQKAAPANKVLSRRRRLVQEIAVVSSAFNTHRGGMLRRLYKLKCLVRKIAPI